MFPIRQGYRLFLVAMLGLFMAVPLSAADEIMPCSSGRPGFWPQWRGPHRDNISTETGLMKEWPKEGPPLVWKTRGVGQGIGSVAMAGGQIYLMGYIGEGEYLTALDERTGDQVWTTRIGPAVDEHPHMRWLSQRTPTVDEERVYGFTSRGELVCLSAVDGKELWRKSYTQDFGTRTQSWGLCDYPLVDGEKLICTPSGAKASIVALNKRTGELIWKSLVPGAQRCWAATVVAEVRGVHQYIGLFQRTVCGVSPSDGKLLWQFEGFPLNYSPHTPLVRDNLVWCAGSRGAGIALLKLVPRANGLRVEEQYRQRMYVDSFHDCATWVDGYVYVPLNGGALACLDAKTGKAVWRARPSVQGGRAGWVFADGHLYLRQSNGAITLVKATPDEYLEKAMFTIPDPQPARGATFPVIAGRRLYIRDDDALLCYDVRADAVGKPHSRPKTRFLTPPMSKLRADRHSTLRSVFVPTPHDVVDRILQLARIQKTSVVVDLGSGDGRIVNAAANQYGCRAMGYEIDQELVDLSRVNAEKAGVGDLVSFERKDIFTVDLSSADVVVVYLLPRQLEKLIPQFEKLKPGARIVSHEIEIPGFKPDKVVAVESREDGEEHHVYLWTTPLTAAD